MKRFALKCLFFVADLLGLNFLFRKINSEKICILMYHGVSSRKLPAFYWTWLALDEFRWQMKYIRRHFRVEKASILYDSEQDISGIKKNVALITFDDGLENVYKEVWAELRNLDLTAICFVLPRLSKERGIVWTDDLYNMVLNSPGRMLDLTRFGLENFDLGTNPDKLAVITRNIGRTLKKWSPQKREELLDYLRNEYCEENDMRGNFRLMTLEQIKEISESNEFEIGPHTQTHPILSTLSPNEQENEIRESVDEIKTWGIEQIPVFAYPNGQPEDFNEDSVDILKKSNMKAALSTIEGLHNRGEDRFRIKRIPIGADVGRWEFKARVSGLFYFLSKMAGRS